MKRLIQKIMILSALIGISMVNQSFTKPEKQILANGTPITFRLKQTINSNEVETGNLIKFETTESVYVRGLEVINTNAPAIGQVVSKNINLQEGYQYIEIEVVRVLAADGSIVSLNSDIYRKTSKNLKTAAEINMGLILTANVKVTVRLTPNTIKN